MATVDRGIIADDVFAPFFGEFDHVEPDKISLDDAIECVLRYAVAHGMIPSRLKTALVAYTDAFTQPER